MSPYRRILVAVDGSPTSRQALAAALRLATGDGAKLRLVHALDQLGYAADIPYGGIDADTVRRAAVKLLDDALATAKAAGADADSKLVDDPLQRIGRTIADEATAWRADLIVVGTHGRRGLDRLVLGSGAEQIIRLAPVQVLVVRGSDA